VVTAVPEPLTVTEILRPAKFETPHPATESGVLKQWAPVVLKLPDWPPVIMLGQSPPPPELLELELLLLELELLLLELELLEEELEDDDELELVPPTVTVKTWGV
jgi:hypothetical protein